ncbi:trace amine-associated receptor 5 [Aplysia californica]|uniref:Trace amine-associated receptor 5 n=1 Tax=Aplysia californica TaxID=6500 RepID=A0ABM0JY23_APLCA|nr:trace amine-associated receptor 5 [Aplysia californica]
MEFPSINISHLLEVGKLINGTASRQSKPSDHLTFAMDTALACTMAIEAPFIVLANILMLVTIIYRRKLHTSDCYIIASLAVADLIMGLVDMPLVTIANIPRIESLMRSHRITCFSWWFSGSLAVFCSLNNICLLSIERFIAINWPFHYSQWLTRERVLGVIVIVWLLEILRTSLIFFVGKYFESAPTLRGKCNYYYGLPMWFHEELGNYKVYVTLSLALVLCTQVTFIALRQVRRIEKVTARYASERREIKRRMRSVRITAAVNYVFFLMWLPRQVEPYISSALQLTKNQTHALHVINQIVMKSNSLLNPLVVALFRPTVREAYKFLLTIPPWRWSEVRYHEIMDSSFYSSTVSKAADITPKSGTRKCTEGEMEVNEAVINEERVEGPANEIVV